MLARFEGARVVATGDYEIEGNRYPWVSLVQFGPELPAELQDYATGEPVRYSVRLPKGETLPALSFGDTLSGLFLTEPETKVVKGTDRSIERQVTRIVALRVEGAQPASRPKAAQESAAA